MVSIVEFIEIQVPAARRSKFPKEQIVYFCGMMPYIMPGGRRFGPAFQHPQNPDRSVQGSAKASDATDPSAQGNSHFHDLIPSCARVEATEKSGEVTSPGPPSRRHIEQDHGPGMESFSAFFGANLNATSYKIPVRSNKFPARQ